MPDFDADMARRVVTDLGRTQNAIDRALRKLSVLATDVIDAFCEARLNDAATQPALDGLAEGFKMMVDGRRAFVSVHQELIAMKVDSNLKHTEIGCDPGPVCPWNAHAPQLSLVG